MKKFALILVALCTIACMSMACNLGTNPSTTSNNQLIGRWISDFMLESEFESESESEFKFESESESEFKFESESESESDSKIRFICTFTKNTYKIATQTLGETKEEEQETSTYSIDGNKIILKLKDGDGTLKKTVQYTLDGNTLILTEKDKPITFTKQ